jgi:hypothetical protein
MPIWPCRGYPGEPVAKVKESARSHSPADQHDGAVGAANQRTELRLLAVDELRSLVEDLRTGCDELPQGVLGAGPEEGDPVAVLKGQAHAEMSFDCAGCATWYVASGLRS